ncbi:MAG: ABC transporter permease, partial [Lentisphaeria bacterium]
MQFHKKIFIKRLIQAPFILFLLITISFFLIRFAPGGPFSTDRELPLEVQKSLEERYHLQKPLPVQYLIYLKNLASLDLGPSMIYKNKSVNTIIKETLPVSTTIGLMAMTLALLIGVSIGIIAALVCGSLKDQSLMIFTIIGISVPSFVVAPILQIIFAIKLNLLPVAGYNGITSYSFLILPVITLALPFTARIARLMRSGMLDTLKKNYIVTAKSKGLNPFRIILLHALPHAIIPVIAYLGPATAAILTGSIVIEKIFLIPGLG